MPVKIEQAIVEDLATMNLVIWEARHPKRFAGISEKTGKPIQREDKSQVNLALAGPGVSAECWGYGSTLQAAVDDALRSPLLIDRVPGLRGAIMRLDRALTELRYGLAAERFKQSPDDLDDDIPF